MGWVGYAAWSMQLPGTQCVAACSCVLLLLPATVCAFCKQSYVTALAS